MSYFGFDILVIEDSDSDFFILEQMMRIQPAGHTLIYRLTRCITLQNAIQHLSQKQYDLIMSDLFLPDSTSPQNTLDVLKEKSPCPIVIMTVLADLNFALEAMRQGAQFYFVKNWIDDNPLLLHFVVLFLTEISRQKKEITDFMGERFQNFRKLIPRCKACTKRIGQPRWKNESDDTWLLPDEYIETLTDIHFTDTYCPECMSEYYSSFIK